MPRAGATTMQPVPSYGRVFRQPARVTHADADPSGRCRLDALARLAQDVASQDWEDSGLAGATAWVARRTMIDVHRWLELGEDVERWTWCSGYGARWAERRTTFVDGHGSAVDMVTLWVQLALDSGRPVRLGEDFVAAYGEAADHRKVSVRGNLAKAWPEQARSAPWHVRFADLDIVGHMNNAAQWAAVEELMDVAALAEAPLRAELEHGTDLHRASDVELHWLALDGGVDLWLGRPGHDGSVGRVRPTTADAG